VTAPEEIPRSCDHAYRTLAIGYNAREEENFFPVATVLLGGLIVETLRGRLSPGNKVLAVVTALLVVSLGGATATMYYTYRMQELFDSAVDRGMSDLTAAHQLETALLNQKGFATYYFLDRDPQWLGQLEVHRKGFETGLQKAREYSDTDSELASLDTIELEYERYVGLKDDVIRYYDSGGEDRGAELHWQVRKRFFELYGLCGQHTEMVKRGIGQIQGDVKFRAKWFSNLTMAAMTVALVLGAVLVLTLFTQILGPIRRLALETASHTNSPLQGDGVEALSSRVHSLISDVDQTRTELGRSRERLLQSERMAVMGTLAAGLAHSIRNPMTSIKMRLFSLERNLELTPTQGEDFEVISEEMHRLDNIVGNFLEFSRPPKLRKQSVHISELVDMTLRLLQHRLELQNVHVERHRERAMPEIDADPELLKEALVNIVVNACEAMKEGGTLSVFEELAVAEEIGQVVMVRFSDTGPGIPESIRDKVFEAFFSSKEDGTGLGLAIAKRIVAEHGGELAFRWGDGPGTTFVITLPVKGNGE